MLRKERFDMSTSHVSFPCACFCSYQERFNILKKLLLALTVLATAVMSGCAHQIQLNPDMSALAESKNKINQAVGYHISEEDRSKKVTTPGGGGDKVSYVPYKDTETALYTVLSNKFSDVYLVKSMQDETFIKENEIKLIFIPDIITNSSSDSLFTWPPTKFMVELEVKAVDHAGNIVWEKLVSTEGHAEFDEFKSDFSLSARRATEKAFMKLAQELETMEPQTATAGK